MPDLPPCDGTPLNANRMNWSEIFRLILLAAIIIGALVLLRATPLGRKMTMENIPLMRAWLSRWGGWAWLVFTVLGTLLLSFGFPRVVLAGIAGAMFGIVKGTLLATLVTTVSAIPPFYYSLFLGREIVMRRLGGRLQRFNALLEHHGFMVILLIRLCPVGNSFVTNCLAGLSAIRFRSYLFASALGFLPMTIICALFGESLAGHSAGRLWIAGGLMVAFSLLFTWYFRRSTLARDVMEVMRDGK